MMKTMMTKGLLALLLVILMVSLIGCAGKTNERVEKAVYAIADMMNTELTDEKVTRNDDGHILSVEYEGLSIKFEYDGSKPVKVKMTSEEYPHHITEEGKVMTWKVHDGIRFNTFEFTFDSSGNLIHFEERDGYYGNAYFEPNEEGKFVPVEKAS